MIIKNYRPYQGLNQIPVAILDTTPTSDKYLQVESLPSEFTSGKNVFKISGNPNIFKHGSPIFIELLDSTGKTVYNYVPDYYDASKKRLVVVQIDENVSPGSALLTICTTVNDALVSREWYNKINFKWQIQINIAPFASNNTDIIYLTPPSVEFSTKVKPFVTASRRNNLEMISYEYGDYQYYDYNFEDYIGDKDSSEAIYQSNKADTLLGSYIDPSITAFDRDNVFFLREENFSAKHVVKNYSILHPDTSFYSSLGPNLIRNHIFSGSALPNITIEEWDTTNVITGFGATNPVGDYFYYDFGSGDYIRQEIQGLDAGSYYLFIAYDFSSTDPLTVELGYDLNRNSGSISEQVSKQITGVNPGVVLNGNAYSAYTAILRASNAGNNLFIQTDAAGVNALLIARLYKISPVSAMDFSMNSDLIGGNIRIKNPNIAPPIPTGYSLLNDDPAYSSYIDQIFQSHDAGVDDKFKYSLVSNNEKNNPGTSYNVIQHPISRYSSTKILDNQIILANPQYTYDVDASVVLFPNAFNCLNPILVNNRFYGTFGQGARTGAGAIFEYDPILKQFKILHSFSSTSDGSNPLGKLLPLRDTTTGRVTFYGTTALGGKYNSGSIYTYVPSTNTFRKLYDFGEYGSTFNIINTGSGTRPVGSLLQASDGLIYGVATFGGTYNAGLIYSYNTASAAYTPVISLTSSYGEAGLIEVCGSLYGPMPFGPGGGSNFGSIYKYTISSSTFTTIHSFSGTDGQNPERTLTLGSDGNLYGTTVTSSIAGEGAVLYKIDPTTDTFTDLFHFDSATEGTYGGAPLFETDGKFYGVCRNGGTYNSGSLFVYDSASNSVSVIHHFQGNPDGSQPAGNLIRLGNSIYGTSRFGGTVNAGTVYRFDLISPSAPFVKIEGGSIIHNNSILPTKIPAYASLVEDYPRWTGPISIEGAGLGVYALVELKLKNLSPLTGDVSKIRIFAKPKGTKSEYIDLGVYSTKPTDILMDTDYVNHVQYAYSPYRLTGYFKPTITDYNVSLAEDPSRRDSLFLEGWATGSVTNSYFSLPDFHNNISIVGSEAAGKPEGSIARMKITSSLSGNGMAYMIYTSSILPPSASTSNVWQQISYELFSAYPILNGMDISSSNYYTASSQVDTIGLNNLLVYSALFRNTGSITIDDIYAAGPAINFNKFNITGSSISSSIGDHPFIFHNKLGWKTDDYLIEDTVAASGSTWMGLLFEYNSSSLFNTTIDSNNPNILEVANVLSREIGDREYMKDTYWEWYSRTKYPLTTLTCSAMADSNTDMLMDSVHLYAVDDPYRGVQEKNKLVFQTKNSYEFIAGVPYIISFNALSKLDYVYPTGGEVIDHNFSSSFNAGGNTWVADNSANWNSAPEEWASHTFNDRTGYLIPPTGSIGAPTNTYINSGGTYTYGAGTYKITIQTGEFTYSTLENPTSIKIEWPSGTIYTISDVQPFNTYSVVVTITAPTTEKPKFIFELSAAEVNSTIYVLDISVKPIKIDNYVEVITGTELINNYFANALSGWSYTAVFPGAGSPAGTAGSTLSITESVAGYNRGDFDHAVDNTPVSLTNVPVRYQIQTGAWQNLNQFNSPGNNSVIVLYVNGGSTEIARIEFPDPNTVYTGTFTIPTLNTGQNIKLLMQLYNPVNGSVNEVVACRITADPIDNSIYPVSPVLLDSTKLEVYGINPTYGIPFRDQITTNDLGEFIGELEHKSEYRIPGETKKFGRVEMEFEVEKDGYGKIGFETDAGSDWYISEISVRPKDRVGITPGYSRTFIRVPAALVNKPLTLKMEYLNDFNIKSPYVTLLNDIIFSNFEETIAIPNASAPADASGGSITPPPSPVTPTTNRYNILSGNVFAYAEAGVTNDTQTDYAPITSVTVNNPNITLVGNKIKFLAAGTYNLVYSANITHLLTEAGPSASTTGMAKFNHYDSSNALVATVQGTTYAAPPPSTNNGTSNLAGSATITVSANDYIQLYLYAHAQVMPATLDIAECDITVNSGYVEVTA